MGEGWARGGQGVGLLPPAIYTYFPCKKLYIEKKKMMCLRSPFFFLKILFVKQ